MLKCACSLLMLRSELYHTFTSGVVISALSCLFIYGWSPLPVELNKPPKLVNKLSAPLKNRLGRLMHIGGTAINSCCDPLADGVSLSEELSAIED